MKFSYNPPGSPGDANCANPNIVALKQRFQCFRTYRSLQDDD